MRKPLSSQKDIPVPSINDYLEHKKLITDVFTQRALEIIFRKDVIKKKRKVHSRLCGFCGNLLAVSPAGEMYACQKVYGNEKIRIGNLLDMDINFSKIEAINDFYNNANFVRPNEKIGLESCSDCEMVYACYNRCPAQNYNSSGGEGYYIRCNEVLYRFYKVYIKNVRKHLWELYSTNDHFKQIVERWAGRTYKSKKKVHN